MLPLNQSSEPPCAERGSWLSDPFWTGLGCWPSSSRKPCSWLVLSMGTGSGMTQWEMYMVQRRKTKLQVKNPPHLTGAPRDWAGFSITVMVVSVSFSGVSVSYSGIDGAGQRTERGWSSAQVLNCAHRFSLMLSLRTLGTFGKGLADHHMAPLWFQQSQPWRPACPWVPSKCRSVWTKAAVMYVASNLHESKSSTPNKQINAGNIS